MKFEQELMSNGDPNPGRCWSEDRDYSIQRFTFYPNSRGKHERCEPWFAAYHYPGGNRVTEDFLKLTFQEAKTAAEAHQLKESNQ